MPKRVLLIAPWFPPLNATESRRAAGFAKYLGDFGWEPLVLTSSYLDSRPPMSSDEVRASIGISDSQVIRVPAGFASPYSDDRRRNWLWRRASALLEAWYLPGSDACRWAKLVLDEFGKRGAKVDAVWATCFHRGAHVAAAMLNKIHRLPWVADFRDVPAGDVVGWPAWVFKGAVWGERRICRSAARLVAVSEPQAELLRQRHEVPVSVIPNGFDPEWLVAQPVRPRPDVFTIVYTGGIYARRDPLPIVFALNDLIQEGVVQEDEVELLFYGASDTPFTGQPAMGSLRKRPRLMPYVSVRDILRVQREATVLLVLGNPGFRGTLTTKLFEYMAAGRPILAYPGDPECMDRVLQDTGAGVSCHSVAELKSVLARWLREWRASGDITMHRKLGEILRFSRKHLAGELASLLDTIMGQQSVRLS